MLWIYVALAGALGALSRFGLHQLFTQLHGKHALATFGINMLGSFLIGLVFVLLPATTLRTVLMVGLLGGFTTFSAFSLELVQYWQNGQYTQLAAYSFGSPILGLATAALGIWLGSQFV